MQVLPLMTKDHPLTNCIKGKKNCCGLCVHGEGANLTVRHLVEINQLESQLEVGICIDKFILS